MVNSSTWLAPAKINLFLHIVGQRADGMHELQTAFQFIDLCDQLSFDLRSDGLIKQSSPISGVSEEQNLCVRAAQLLQQSTDVAQGVTIHLHKKIPIGGGLGGASSNAATTLLALNQLWQTELASNQLMDLALELGADVPVFVGGKAAWAEGVGERLTAVEAKEYWYVVVDAGVHVSTRTMFAHPQLTRNNRQLTICPPEPGVLGNAFEPIVRSSYPAINDVFEWLANYGKPFLTGTGGCVVTPFEKYESALAVQAQAPPELTVYVAKGMNISPLMEQLS